MLAAVVFHHCYFLYPFLPTNPCLVCTGFILNLPSLSRSALSRGFLCSLSLVIRSSLLWILYLSDVCILGHGPSGKQQKVLPPARDISNSSFISSICSLFRIPSSAAQASFWYPTALVSSDLSRNAPIHARRERGSQSEDQIRSYSCVLARFGSQSGSALFSEGKSGVGRWAKLLLWSQTTDGFFRLLWVRPMPRPHPPPRPSLTDTMRVVCSPRSSPLSYCFTACRCRWDFIPFATETSSSRQCLEESS